MTGPKIVPECVVPLQDAKTQEISVKKLLKEVFPSWSVDRIDVLSLKGGITNCLLQATYKKGSLQQETVLVRAYGRGTGTIIDRNREFCTHVHLHTNGLAPALYARFKNGLVYGYVQGRAVDYRELGNPILINSVASMLAQWHTVLDASEIRKLMLEESDGKDGEFVDDIWQLCAKWIGNLPAETSAQIETKEVLSKELEWVKNEIQNKGGPTVVAHCDLLSGNVIVPKDWQPNRENAIPPTVTFIDYEYALPTPRAFDLANHFMEWQGFDCEVSLIPEAGGPVMREWGRQYLQASLTFDRGQSGKNGLQTISENDVDELMNEIATWWGMPGFYWGIWSTIQAIISTIDFDYSSYAQSRMLEYWSWKENYLR
ncbi:kinase-like domain-containing protein [Lipomyces japonicus]|uniref:kinase-like domain-containing protein n=1 Tax=Lipomyces japonicus TaxID=56871 RepID=UPI0034CE4DA2